MEKKEEEESSLFVLANCSDDTYLQNVLRSIMVKRKLGEREGVIRAGRPVPREAVA